MAIYIDVKDLKQYIYDNNKLEYILTELEMHHIKPHNNGKYFTCGFKGGDNTKSTVCYNDEFMNVEAYTRNIKDKFGNSDIISLICFVKDCYFSNGIKWTCEVLGIDYYADTTEDIPESLKWTKMIQEMSSNFNSEPEEKEWLKPISEKILTYYKPYVNDIFFNEGIGYQTQKLFEIGYDQESNRITFPIRDELASLVGVKGRLYGEVPEGEQKYLYLERCAKSHILYGLYLTMPHIKEKDCLIIVESEKNLLKLWEWGYKNAVSIGGHNLSKKQIEKIIQLGISEVIICYDEDVNRYKTVNGEQVLQTRKEFLDSYTEEVNKFISQQKVSIMVDIDRSILDEKESPADDLEKFKLMYENRILIR